MFTLVTQVQAKSAFGKEAKAHELFPLPMQHNVAQVFLKRKMLILVTTKTAI